MTPGTRHIVRFKPYQRAMHLVLFTSFLGLATTGLPLMFSDRPWAGALARGLGGIEAAGILHRIFAVMLLALFAVHLAELAWRLTRRKEHGLLWGPTSMVPQPRDAAQMWQHVRWFVGKAERPHFDRFTYWEKFDYWAVVWGMVIIGGSGLLLWFPEFFAAFFPGWIYNVALILHGEEALLATGFIFTIHFFNSHFRPEKFPMDMVMFTGQVTEEELLSERPAEYERMARDGTLETLAAPPAPGWLSLGGRIVGGAAVAVGLVLLVLILVGTL
ncbi:MAG: formate dehydrogenase subunit gamma [Vicinamibacterales bacterium]